MPTYEYQCKKCDERLEVFQSFSARPLKRHEICGGNLEKVFHPSGIVFKGSGFYVNDSRGRSSSSSPSPSSSSSSSSESSTESSTGSSTGSASAGSSGSSGSSASAASGSTGSSDG